MPATGVSRDEESTTNRSRRITIAVHDSIPLGRNTRHLADLYSTASQRIPADLQIPFFVVETRVSLPKDVRLQSHARAVVDGSLGGCL